MSASQVETLEHVAAQMLREDRPTWAALVAQAAKALEGTTPGDPGLIEMLDYVAEVMVAKERPAWAGQVVAAAQELRRRLDLERARDPHRPRTTRTERKAR